MSITREDIKALRIAGDLSLHSYVDSNTGERTSWLGPTIQRFASEDKPVIWTAVEQALYPELMTDRNDWRRRRITVDGATFHQYDRTRENPRAYASTDAGVLRTLRVLLRAGDDILLQFVAGNNNDYLRNAGLNLDEAHIIIRRKGSLVAELLADVSVCQDNTARMVNGA